MTVGPLEGLTSAVGDELTELSGFRSTRLTALLLPEQDIANGINTATSVDSGVTVTLSSGTYPLTVVPGTRFRITSGALIGQTGVVLTRDSAIQVTLTGTGIGSNFASESWEIVLDAETTATVETTLNWDDAGTVFIDSVRYTYASKTLTTFDGLRHFDGVLFVDGAQKRHEVLFQVGFEHRDRLCVETCRPAVALHHFEGFAHDLGSDPSGEGMHAEFPWRNSEHTSDPP